MDVKIGLSFDELSSNGIPVINRAGLIVEKIGW
jgi:hypothetical protein